MSFSAIHIYSISWHALKQKLYSTNSLLWLDHFLLFPFLLSVFIVCTFFRLESKSEGLIVSHRKAVGWHATYAEIYVLIWDADSGVAWFFFFCRFSSNGKTPNFLNAFLWFTSLFNIEKQFPSPKNQQKTAILTFILKWLHMNICISCSQRGLVFA